MKRVVHRGIPSGGGLVVPLSSAFQVGGGKMTCHQYNLRVRTLDASMVEGYIRLDELFREAASRRPH